MKTKSAKNFRKTAKASLKLGQMKRGMRVFDRWWPWRPIGYVEMVLKTRARIRFGADVVTYDRAHVQFLELVAGRAGKGRDVA